MLGTAKIPIASNIKHVRELHSLPAPGSMNKSKSKKTNTKPANPDIKDNVIQISGCVFFNPL